jgi:hypothetical protein
MSLTACAPDPEIWLLRVALWPGERSEGCWFPEDGPTPNDSDDTDNDGTPATWTMYMTGDDTAMLEIGGQAIAGETTETGFKFASERVDVEWANADGTGAKFTTTDVVKVTLDIDDPRVTGSVLRSNDFVCEGADCPMDLADYAGCDTTEQVWGTIVPDPEFDVAP